VKHIKTLILNQKGQTLAEYSWVLVLIAVLLVLMLTATGSQVENKYSQINSSVDNAVNR
jgi:Flp pilus assembly pilin Flp